MLFLPRLLFISLGRQPVGHEETRLGAERRATVHVPRVTATGESAGCRVLLLGLENGIVLDDEGAVCDICYAAVAMVEHGSLQQVCVGRSPLVRVLDASGQPIRPPPGVDFATPSALLTAPQQAARNWFVFGHQDELLDHHATTPHPDSYRARVVDPLCAMAMDFYLWYTKDWPGPVTREFSTAQALRRALRRAFPQGQEKNDDQEQEEEERGKEERGNEDQFVAVDDVVGAADDASAARTA